MAKALVVDDATIMRVNITNMLKQMGHEVIAQADTGSKAIDQYKEHKPDFVTMDITMPEENDIANGIEAVKKIREIDGLAKIIMVTSHGEEEKVIKAIQSGASNYVLKPIKYEKLEEVVSKLGLI